MGFNAPYFHLFNELTAIENIQVLAKARGVSFTVKELNVLLEKFQLAKKGHISIQHFSSGMQQRIKLLCATLFNPSFLFLDEPTSNLDVYGKQLVEALVAEQKKMGITVICTNEVNEAEWGNKTIALS